MGHNAASVFVLRLQIFPLFVLINVANTLPSASAWRSSIPYSSTGSLAQSRSSSRWLAHQSFHLHDSISLSLFALSLSDCDEYTPLHKTILYGILALYCNVRVYSCVEVSFEYYVVRC
jgi:hypothetical protein